VILVTDSEQKYVGDIGEADGRRAGGRHDCRCIALRRSTDETGGGLAISSNKALMKCLESHGHATRRRPDKMPFPPDVHSSPSPRSDPPAGLPSARGPGRWSVRAPRWILIDRRSTGLRPPG